MSDAAPVRLGDDTAPSAEPESSVGTSVALNGVALRYGDPVTGTLALKNTEFSVEAGEFVAIVGPSGCGKSTLMKLVSGLAPATEGTVTIDGLDVRQSPVEAKKRIGYIPDHPFLYSKLRGWEFLHFVGGLYRMKSNEVRARGGELLEVFDLASVAGDLIGSYSHGMRQRLGIAHPHVDTVTETATSRLDEPRRSIHSCQRRRRAHVDDRRRQLR